METELFVEVRHFQLHGITLGGKYIIGRYPHHVSHSETEFRIGVFLGKIICRKLEFPQI